jgi:hypothetical protein
MHQSVAVLNLAANMALGGPNPWATLVIISVFFANLVPLHRIVCLAQTCCVSIGGGV